MKHDNDRIMESTDEREVKNKEESLMRAKMIGLIVVVVTVFLGGLYGAYVVGRRSVTISREPAAAVQATPTPLPATTAEKPSIPIRVAEVTLQDVTVTETFYGTAAPYADINVQGKYGGKIVLMKANKGDEVKKGEIIVRFDDSDVQLQLQQATAAKNTASERVKQTESDFQTVQADVERQEKLLADGVVAQKTVDDARNRLQSAQSALNSAREAVKQAESQIAILQNTLKDYQLAAPISGVVAEKKYEAQEIYRAGDVLYHLIDIDRVHVDIEVPETYISQVKEKMDVTVQFDSLQDSAFPAQIELIAPKGDAQSRSFIVHAVIKNTDRAIKPGMFARVSVPLKRFTKSLVVDRNALVQRDNRTYVMTVSDDQVRKIEVDVRYQDETIAVILTEELIAGDKVVIEGAGRLKDGDRVAVK